MHAERKLPGSLRAKEPTMPTAPSEEVVLKWFDELSNWGRWGEDDVLGTLNHITPEARVAAAGLVRDGVTVSCSWDIRTGPQPGSTVENQRYMLSTGLGLKDEGRKNLLAGGRAGGAQEFIGIVFHGLDVTHLDSLAHIFWDGKLYGGKPASMVTDRQGAIAHDVLSVSQGVSTRGVLLDIARLRGVDVLAADDHVYPEDLQAAAEAAGIEVRAGDVILMRTGEGGARIREKRNYNANKPRSGYQAACLPFFHERGVAMLASDVAQDPTPAGYRQVNMPIHMVGIVAMGMWLIDNCQLEDLAETCARLNRWEFQFALAPIRFQGVTGSPVNPLAIF
jgi:kynurenine formamidase